MPSVPYIRFYTDFPRHRKTVALKRILGAYEYILNLWAWAAENAPDGDLTSFSVDEIELEARWTGERGKAFEAFVAVGFVDVVPGNVTGNKVGNVANSVSLHNWMERTGQGVDRLLKYREKKRTAMKTRRNSIVSEKEGESVVGNVTGNNTGNPITITLSSSESSYSPSGSGSSLPRDPCTVRPKHMQASAWHFSFGLAWCKSKEKLRYAHPSDSVARGRFDEMLDGLDPDDVLEVWNRKDEVFAEFLASSDRKTIEAGHQFSFFVSNFLYFMLPKDKRQAQPGKKNTKFGGELPANWMEGIK